MMDIYLGCFQFGACTPPPNKIPMLKLKPHHDGIRKWAFGGDLVRRVEPSGMGLVPLFFLKAAESS